MITIAEGFRIASAYVQVSPDTTGFKEKLDADLSGDNTTVKIPASLNTEAFRADLKANLDQITATLKQQLDAELSGQEKFRAQVEELAKGLGGSKPKVKIPVEIDPESRAKFEAEIQALKDLGTRSASSSANSTPNPGAAAAAGAGGGGLGFGAMLGVGAALGAGAIGGASLLMIPALFTAIGVAAEKSDPQVTAAFSDMTTAAKKTISDGFAPFAPVLADLAGETKATVTGMGSSFHEAAVVAAPLLQIVGHDFLAATQAGVGESVPLLQGMRPVAQALGDDLMKTEQGIGGFFKNLDVGSAAQGLAAVGNVVKDDVPAVASLINDIAPLGTALLNVLAPALRGVVGELGFLKPVLEVVGAGLQFLSPVISALAGPLIAAEGATKLLTGSWSDYSGALTKALGAINLTTAAAKESAVQSAQDAATKTALQSAVDKLAVSQAEEAVSADASAKNKLALIAAQEAEAVSAKAATAAQDTLTAAERTATISMGPLGIALGVIGGALALVGMNASKTTAPTSDLTDELLRLAKAAPDATQSILDGDPALTDLVNKAKAAGVNVSDLLSAYSQGPDALKSFSDALTKQNQDLGNSMIGLSAGSDNIEHQVQDLNKAQSVSSVKDLVNAVNSGTTSYDLLDPAVKKVVDTYRAQTQVQGQLSTTITTLTQRQDAANAVATDAAAKTKLSRDQQLEATGIAAAFGVSIDSVSAAFRDYASGVTYGLDAGQKIAGQFLTQKLAVASANETVDNYFKTADAAVVSASQSLSDANHSVAQSVDAVASAQHSLAQSAQAVVTAQQGVATAQRGVATAEQGVETAEQNLTRAQQQSQQAQVNLNTARAAAVEQLKALHLQLADQVTSEESARVALFDQQRQSAGIGVTLANAAGIAAQDVTAANEGQVNSAIALLKAQQALNDTLNTGQNLRTQVTAADQAGVDNAPSVLSAQQALVQAQQQVVTSTQAVATAQQSVVDAQANVVKAEQGVTDALYNEQQARKAVADALYNEGKAMQAVTAAQVALQTAQDNASRSMDIGTVAGQRNLAMLQQVSQQLFTNERPQQAANDLVAQTAKLFDITTTAAANYLKQQALIPQDFKFSITSVATADLSELDNAYSTILARGAKASPGMPVPFAEGGPIGGTGGPTEDSNLIWASRGEFMQPTASHDYYGTPVMEAMRQKLIPKELFAGYATGGAIGTLYDTLAIGALGDYYQTAANTLGVLGVPVPPGPKSLPAYVPPAPAASSGGHSAPAAGGVAAAAQAYAASILGNYGWGSDQMPPLISLWNQESGWNPNAINPSSGAYGIPQSLGHGHPYNLGDYIAQINWGLSYIAGRYGSPAAAWGHEVSNNWYDQGGLLPPGLSLAVNNTGAGEHKAVFTDQQWAALQAIAGSGAHEVHHHSNHWNVSTQDPYMAAKLVAAQQAWNNMIGVHA